jgi:hypothetical protein
MVLILIVMSQDLQSSYYNFSHDRKMKIQALVKDCRAKFGEAWLSCLLVMVQGDISGLSIKHALIAAKTGFFASLAYFVVMLLLKQSSPFIEIVLIGVLTAGVDVLVHPTHFGEWYSEALVTGFGASMLALVIHFTLHNRNKF